MVSEKVFKVVNLMKAHDVAMEQGDTKRASALLDEQVDIIDIMTPREKRDLDKELQRYEDSYIAGKMNWRRANKSSAFMDRIEKISGVKIKKK